MELENLKDYEAFEEVDKEEEIKTRGRRWVISKKEKHVYGFRAIFGVDSVIKTGGDEAIKNDCQGAEEKVFRRRGFELFLAANYGDDGRLLNTGNEDTKFSRGGH